MYQSVPRGTFATVNLAVELGAYRQIACKTTRPKNIELRDTHTVMKEVTILKSLCHVSPAFKTNKICRLSENAAEYQ
jgi:hypothetical protein